MALNEELEEEIEAVEAIFGPRISIDRPSVLDKLEGIGVKIELGDGCSHVLRLVLPHEYPAATVSAATVTAVRGDRLSLAHAADCATLDDQLQAYVRDELTPGEPAIFEVAQHAAELLESAVASSSPACPRPDEGSGSAGGRPGQSDEGDGCAAAAPVLATVVPQALNRQWIYFLGFYTKSIRAAFCELAAECECTGFLMPGKPAVAAVEGTEAAIARYVRLVRTELFAQVPPAMRKMTLSLLDSDIKTRAFEGFEQMEFSAQSGTHKRKDITDLARLEVFLNEHGCRHAFDFIFHSSAK